MSSGLGVESAFDPSINTSPPDDEACEDRENNAVVVQSPEEDETQHFDYHDDDQSPETEAITCKIFNVTTMNDDAFDVKEEADDEECNFEEEHEEHGARSDHDDGAIVDEGDDDDETNNDDSKFSPSPLKVRSDIFEVKDTRRMDAATYFSRVGDEGTTEEASAADDEDVVRMVSRLHAKFESGFYDDKSRDSSDSDSSRIQTSDINNKNNLSSTEEFRDSSDSDSSRFLTSDINNRSILSSTEGFRGFESSDYCASEESGFIVDKELRSSSNPTPASPRSVDEPTTSTPMKMPGIDVTDREAEKDLRTMLRMRKSEDDLQERNKMAEMLAAKDLEILLHRQRELVMLSRERKAFKEKLDQFEADVGRQRAELHGQQLELEMKYAACLKLVEESNSNLEKSKKCKKRNSSVASEESREEPIPSKVVVMMSPINDDKPPMFHKRKIVHKIDINEPSKESLNKRPTEAKIKKHDDQDDYLAKNSRSLTYTKYSEDREFERMLEKNECVVQSKGRGVFCGICNVIVTSKASTKEHIEGRKHKDNLYERDNERCKPKFRDLRSKLRRRNYEFYE